MRRSSDVFAAVQTRRQGRLPTLRTAAMVGLTTSLILAIFFGGEYVQRHVAYRRVRASDPHLPTVDLVVPAKALILNTLFRLPRPFADAKLAGSGLPVYDLRIAPKDLLKLQRTAEQVTARSDARGITREYVPAQFMMDGDWVPINVKLRGLTDRHYFKARPSLRLKFPNNHLLDGKKQINLSDPYDKELTADVTALWELQRHGLMTWNGRFVVLRLNGDVIGLFQEIEQWGRSMADRQGRPEGFIFSGQGQFFGKEGPGYDKAREAIDLVRACGGTPETPPAEHCNWEFLSEYFDADKWAWAGAMTALVGSGHAWGPDNVRLFWDPARGKFEPIPWDYLHFRLGLEDHPEGEAIRPGYGMTICGIPQFRRLRDQRLWTLLTRRVDAMIEHADGLFEELTGPLAYDDRNITLAKDRKQHAMYVNDLRENKQYLMERFRQHDLRAAYWIGDLGDVTLRLENHGKSFLEVTRIVARNGRQRYSQSLAEPVLVDGMWFTEPGRHCVVISMPPGAEPISLVVQDQVTGAMLPDDEISITPGAGTVPIVPPPAEPRPFRVSVDRVHVGPSQVTFGPGRVVLDRSLSIPPAYEVAFAPGLELNLGADASLFIYGNLTSVGTRASPIRIAGTGPKEPWGGLFLQGTRTAPVSVRMEHTFFEGGTGGQNDRVHFTGTLAVHDGVVVLKSCSFKNSAADDGVNLKYCKFELRKNLFAGSKDDAVDLDFCTGSIVDNRFLGAGGDGLDLSGSDVVVERNSISHCADKGVSIGERTRATLGDNEIADCHTGVAVKDLSEAMIRDCRLARLEVGVALYIKKRTFGPSRAKLEAVVMRDVATDVSRDEACTLER